MEEDETKLEQLDEMLDKWDHSRNTLLYEYTCRLHLRLYVKDSGWSVKRYTNPDLFLSKMTIARGDETEVEEIAEAVRNITPKQIEQKI
jgi:hypothetical protein